MEHSTTKEDIQKLLKKDEIIVNFKYTIDGKDGDNYPLFKIDFIDPPKNYQLVNIIEPLKIAVLRDFNYAQ